MAEKNKDAELARLTNELTKDFARWDHLSYHGGQDPFWPDGVNLNLVRNHIIYNKRAIAQLVEAEQDELSFFGVTYPDIYYRATPAEVFPHYMVKAVEIRQRAQEQLALYEKDPNFLYILANHNKVFPKGETRATKEAGLSIWKTCGLTRYRKDVERDDLVAMRRDFYEPYENKAIRWAEGAQGLRRFLEMEHNPEDDVVIVEEEEEFTEEYSAEETEEISEEETVSVPSRKSSLDQLISGAKARSEAQHKEDKHPEKEREQQEQLALF